MAAPLIHTARSAALFCSQLSACDLPHDTGLGPAEVTAAVAAALASHGGSPGCAARVAAEYGDHPETASARMQWALQVVQRAFPCG